MDFRDTAQKIIAAGAPVLGGMLAAAAPAIGEELGKALPVPFGSTIGRWAGEQLAAALGVEPTPAAVAEAVAKKTPEELATVLAEPEAAAVAKWRALETAEREATKRLQAGLKSDQDAREAQRELVKLDSPQQWGQPVVASIVVIGFVGVLFIWLVSPPTGNQMAMTTLNILLGALGAAFQQVVNYYLGSSVGSRSKDSALHEAISKSR